ncbi:hypothetical protein BJV74DRAFT_873365 [Russula compacta]|nr:hypothetical protein BJV74DRAFT_873365 [Russula compacta]
MMRLALLALSVIGVGATSVYVREAQQVRQSSGSAYDSQCNKVMCIEASVEGDTARYILRSTGEQGLGWMAVGFGHRMAHTPMVIMWPSRDGEDGSYGSVTLSQRTAPYETMPTLDTDPPFNATLDISITTVTGEYPQMAFTRPAPGDGMQNIIWAFSRTPPVSADVDVHIAVHHLFGRAKLNLTRTAASPSEDEDAPPPVPVPVPVPSAEVGDDKGDGKAEKPSSGVGGFANFVHAALCTVAFLLVIPSGALVVRFAKVTGSPAAFNLHRNLQFGVAGTCIAGGVIAYLFMDDDDGSGSGAAHKFWGTALALSYGVQCVVGFWVQRIPAQSRTRVHSMLLAGLGASIVLLAFYDTWLGFVAAGDGTLLWCILFVVSNKNGSAPSSIRRKAKAMVFRLFPRCTLLER